MAQQYIYSRTDQGYGFTAASPGMTQELQDDAGPHCVPGLKRPESGQVAALSQFRKLRLARSGKVLLQGSAWIGEEDEPSCVSHGYVLDSDELAAAPVENWLALPFHLDSPGQDAQLEDLERLETRAFQRRSLSRIMELGLDLDKESFCQMLLACFDALEAHRQVLIALDLSSPAARKVRGQVLFWVYSCLPLALRQDLGFASVFTGDCAPRQIQLAFVDKADVRSGVQLAVETDGQTIPVGGGFLVMDGQILHNGKYPCAWYGQDNLFARWLREVVDILWEPGYEALWDDALEDLRDAYAGFARQLGRVPPEKRLDPDLYSAACWSALEGAQRSLAMVADHLRASLSEQERRTFGVTVLTRLGSGESGEAQDRVLDEMIQRRRTPAGKEELDVLASLLTGGQRVRGKALALLGAFLALDADYPEAIITRVMRRYEKLLPPEGWAQLPRRLLFGQLEQEERGVWERCGAAFDESALERRRGAWCAETLEACGSVHALPGFIGQETDALPGLDARQREALALEMARRALDILERIEPTPGIRDVSDLVRMSEPYQDSACWDGLCQAAQELAARCRPTAGELTLSAMEELSQVFSPHAGDERLSACWQELLRLQCIGVARREGAIPPDAGTPGRIRELSAALPRSFPERLRQDLDGMLTRVYEQLLDDPQSFMTGKWLRREASFRPFPDNDASWMIYLLAEFAGEEQQSVPLWRSLCETYGGSDASRRYVLGDVLPKMFLAGTLPGVTPPFVVQFLHSQPSQVPQLLLQCAAQGGGPLLRSVLERAEKYEREMKSGGPTDLTVILRTVSGDPRILATAADVDGDLSFAEKLVGYLSDLERRGRLSGGEAASAAQSLLQFHEARGAGALKKMSVRRTAGKLMRRS